ncbi:MAG: hypothetical protein QOE70_1406 [Chthoniobacter sp.]|jgi:hypothetical protein|nr:hypothetical protein [Chthoniobacter sp.]
MRGRLQAVNRIEPESVGTLEDAAKGDGTRAEVGEHPLLRYAGILSQRYAVKKETTTAILLATVAGALGPARWVRSPSGGSLPASLNVLVSGDRNHMGLLAMRRAMAPLVDLAEKYVEVRRLKGEPNLRREKILLEKRGAELLNQLGCCRAAEEAQIAKPWSRHPDLDADERRKLHKESEEVGVRLQEFGLEERPWLISDGISPQAVRELNTRSFDRSLMNYSPDGHAWHSLLSSSEGARAEQLRALHAGWLGESLRLESECIVGLVVSNLWLLDPADLESKRLRGVQGDWIWDTFLLANVGDLEAELDPCLLMATEEDGWWFDIIHNAILTRVREHAVARHVVALSCSATCVLVDYWNVERAASRAVAGEARRFSNRRLEQVLKVALLLYMTHSSDEEEIGVDLVKTAIRIVTEMAAAGPRLGAQSFQEPQVQLEVEVQTMVAKLKLNGPQTKRTLFRRYNLQQYSHLEPILLRALEAKQIAADGEFYAAVD